MLSVVIPVYNVSPYLDKCIESVVEQTYKELEIILINDGSTDDSAEICREWAKKDTRILFIDKQNEGSGATRNLGIQKATGEYIAFLDSDDWWDLEYASLMMEQAKKADVVVCDMMYVDFDKDGNDISHVSKIRLPGNQPFTPEEIPDVINIARTFLCGKIFKKSLFTENGITQPSMAINDFPIVIPLVALAGSVARVDVPLYYYLRGREGNTVTSIKALWSFGEALEALKENMQKFGLEQRFQKALYKMYYSQVRFALKKGIIAVENGLEIEEYDKLEQYLISFLKREWSEYPEVEKRKIAANGDPVLEEALKLLVIDERQIVGVEDSDYYVVWENDQVDDKRRCIQVKERQLKGEDLYWAIADEILFAMGGK